MFAVIFIAYSSLFHTWLFFFGNIFYCMPLCYFTDQLVFICSAYRKFQRNSDEKLSLPHGLPQVLVRHIKAKFVVLQIQHYHRYMAWFVKHGKMAIYWCESIEIWLRLAGNIIFQISDLFFESINRRFSFSIESSMQVV